MTDPIAYAAERLKDPNAFPRAGGAFYACFNSTAADQRAGYAAVRKHCGEAAVKRLKRVNKTGLLAMFNVPPTAESRLLVCTIADRVESRFVANDKWMFGEPVDAAVADAKRGAE
jgi:hypothetical protein